MTITLQRTERTDSGCRSLVALLSLGYVNCNRDSLLTEIQYFSAMHVGSLFIPSAVNFDKSTV